MTDHLPRTRRSLIATGAGTLVALIASAASWRALAQDDHDPAVHPHGPATPAATPGTPAATPVSGHDHSHGADPATGTGVGGLYLTLANADLEPDALLGGTTNVCRAVEPHTMRIDGGVATMTFAADGLPVPAGATVTLTPDGDHVMLVDLTQDLRPDTAYDITLRFAVAGEIALTVPVRWDDPAAAGDAGASITAGAITVSAAWSRPAPMIGG